MAAKLLHSLTDDNPDLQKQIGCMTGIFQLFDRQLVVADGRRVGGHNPKRLLPPDNSPNVSLGRELRPSTTAGKNPYKDIHQEKQRPTNESSRASLSSSRSSSFSSLDGNRSSQLEPSSFDRIIFPENPSFDPSMSVQSSSPRFSSRQSLDLRDFVKDSMYREVQSLAGKSKITEESNVDEMKKKKKTPADIKESLRVLNGKLQESSSRRQNEPRGLMRSSSYNHSKDLSPVSASKDAPRYSYDGRELSRVSFDSSDVYRSNHKHREFLKPPSDIGESSVRNSNSFLKTKQTPSVVAKLMGLDALPDNSPGKKSKSYAYEDEADSSRLFIKNESNAVRVSSSNSKSLCKEPSSPSWRSNDSSKHISRITVEPAPWKQIDPSKNSLKQIPKSPRTSQAKASSSTPYNSVYSEIEKRIKDLEFSESGKDLRALKQILDAMQSKGFLEPEKEEEEEEGPASHEGTFSGDMRSSNEQRTKAYNQEFVSTKRRAGYPPRAYQSPIVIMKPAKLIEEFPTPSASVISLEGLGDGNRISSFRTSKERIRASVTAPPLAKEGSSRAGRGAELSTSPRLLQQNKPVIEKKARPPTPPSDSRKPRRQLKQQIESSSPGGRRRVKYANVRQNEEILDEIVAENDASVQFRTNETNLWSSNDSTKDLVGKLAEEEATEFGFVPQEFSSPVSVLDNTTYRDDSSPSPVKFVSKTINIDAASETSAEYGSTYETNRKKLENVENLVQKLRRLNSKHDEERTDYIASLCESADADHRYVSEILLASGLLLIRELTNFQFHPSGHPINPELFLVLEQTKSSSSLLQELGEEKTQSKLHRKLIFDSVNEILGRKLTLARSSPEPWSRWTAKKTVQAQKLLRDLCSEIEVLKAKNDRFSSDEGEDERWRKILCWDVMNDSKGWTNVEEQISGAVLDIERSIFKDLVDEIVIGESSFAGSNAARKRRLSK